MIKMLNERVVGLAEAARRKERAAWTILAHFKMAEQALGALSIVYADRYKIFLIDSYASGFAVQAIIQLDVNDMREVEPLLAVLENSMGIVFDKSQDRADVGWRQFDSKDAPWLRVDAMVKEESTGCRKEVMGYEQTPKYEFKCD